MTEFDFDQLARGRVRNAVEVAWKKEGVLSLGLSKYLADGDTIVEAQLRTPCGWCPDGVEINAAGTGIKVTVSPGQDHSCEYPLDVAVLTKSGEAFMPIYVWLRSGKLGGGPWNKREAVVLPEPA